MPTTYTLGKLLAETRESRGLAVEDIAHKTRIPASTIRCLENDDYSQFPNLVYARSFLRLYSAHLDVDASEFLGELEELSRSNRGQGGYFSGQFNRKEIDEITSWKNFVPVRPILTTLFFIAVGVPAAWWVVDRYIDYQKEQQNAPPPVAGSNPAPGPAPAPAPANNDQSRAEPAETEEPGGAGGALVNRPAPVLPEDLANAPRAEPVPPPDKEEPAPVGEAGGGEATTEATTDSSPDAESSGSPVARASVDRPRE